MLRSPRVVVAPGVRVQVEGAVVEGGDGEVLDEVDTFVNRVGVGVVVAGERRGSRLWSSGRSCGRC